METLESAPVADPAKTAKEEPKETKPTLDDIAKQTKEMNDRLNQVLKQNADKDSHISRIESENAKLRDTLQKVTSSIEGKTEKQKDAIIERERRKLLDQGFQSEAVDSILESVSAIADEKANSRIAPILMEEAQDRIESDSEIDKTFLEANRESIMSEYHGFKQEISPRKIHLNLKKAYKIVKERLADEARAKETPEEKARREAMLPGGQPSPGTKKEEVTGDTAFLDRIDKAGSGKNSLFV